MTVEDESRGWAEVLKTPHVLTKSALKGPKQSSFFFSLFMQITNIHCLWILFLVLFLFAS